MRTQVVAKSTTPSAAPAPAWLPSNWQSWTHAEAVPPEAAAPTISTAFNVALLEEIWHCDSHSCPLLKMAAPLKAWLNDSVHPLIRRDPAFDTAPPPGSLPRCMYAWISVRLCTSTLTPAATRRMRRGELKSAFASRVTPLLSPTSTTLRDMFSSRLSKYGEPLIAMVMSVTLESSSVV